MRAMFSYDARHKYSLGSVIKFSGKSSCMRDRVTFIIDTDDGRRSSTH